MRKNLFLFALISAALNCYGQTKQMAINHPGRHVVIHDSKTDHDGNVVHVGQLSFQSAFDQNPDSGLVIKTDPSGVMLWSRQLRFDAPAIKVIIAANGDYIVLQDLHSGVLSRFDVNGNMKWQRYYSFTSATVGHPVNSIAELPDGRIVLAGTNDFDNQLSWDYWRGYLQVTDSAGAYQKLKIFGNTPQGPSTTAFSFNDLEVWGDKIVVVGGHGIHYDGIGKPMIMIFSQNFEPLSMHYLTVPLINATVGNTYTQLTDISIVDNKIFLHGAAADSTVQNIPRFQLVASYDTLTHVLQGHRFLPPAPYTRINSPRFLVKDSTTYYAVMSPKPVAINYGFYPAPGNDIVTKMVNGTPEYSRMVKHDSTNLVRSICFSGDSLLLTGYVRDKGKGAGFYAFFPESMPTTGACNLVNTSIFIDTFLRTLVPGEIPFKDSQYVNLFSGIAAGAANLHFNELCLTGVEPLAAEVGDVFMYPNPADRMVVFRNHTKGNIRITISDITGKYIAGVTQDPGDATYTVEELGLSAGMYIVTMRVGDVLRKERLLVTPSQ